jgi:hypothetical protein
MECRHLDGNPANNRLENLAWGTDKENGQDRIRHGRKSGGRGESNGRALLTEDIVRQIRREAPGLRKYGRATSLAKKFGVSPSAIRFVLDGKNWSHVA